MKDLFNVPVCTNNVSRFAGKQVLAHRSTISEHSFEVTYYATLIANRLRSIEVIGNTTAIDIIEYSLVHDIPEIFTGDVPYTAKARFPELKETLNKVEEEIWREVLPTFKTPPTNEAKFICKIADAIAVSREIVTEHSMGNIFFGEDELDNCRNIFRTCFNNYKSKVSNEVWVSTLDTLMYLVKDTSIHQLVWDAL